MLPFCRAGVPEILQRTTPPPLPPAKNALYDYVRVICFLVFVCGVAR